MPKCRIRWIDGDGAVTPDDNEAVGYVTCHNSTDTRPESDHERYPICEAHAKRIPPPWFAPGEGFGGLFPPYVSWWTFHLFEKEE